MAKMLNSSYLYNKFPDYDKMLFTALNRATQIDKNSSGFDDIKFEVKKRQISNALIKVLNSPSVVLLQCPMPLPKQFKVFVAKDLKSTQKIHKVYIDCTDLIRSSGGGNYECRNVDILIAYLVDAMNSLIYFKDERRITSDHGIIQNGAECFAKLFAAILDYIYKISVTGNTKSKAMYLASLFYINSMLEKDIESTSMRAIARGISGLSEREEQVLEMQINKNTFMNINYFIKDCGDILKLPNMAIDIILDRWMKMYGVGTALALELYPSLASMITNAYVGCYINQQKSIEKICGRSMVEFSKDILRIGEGAV